MAKQPLCFAFFRVLLMSCKVNFRFIVRSAVTEFSSEIASVFPDSSESTTIKSWSSIEMGVTTSERAWVSAAKYLEQDTLLNRITLPKRRPRLEERCHPKLPSNPRTKAVCGLSLMSVLSFVQEIFLRVVRCSPFLENKRFQIPTRPGIRNTKNHKVDVLQPLNRYFYLFDVYIWFIYLSFIYLFIYINTSSSQVKWSVC